MPGGDDNIDAAFRRGLSLARAGEYFEAHEAFEAAWRSAEPGERDFFQGLVHAVVSAYQQGRGRTVAAARQRAKGLTRLAAYGPVHRGLELEPLRGALRGGETDLRERLVERDSQPPAAVDKEQHTERDERRA